MDSDVDLAAVGARVRTARERAGLTQRDVELLELDDRLDSAVPDLRRPAITDGPAVPGIGGSDERGRALAAQVRTILGAGAGKGPLDVRVSASSAADCRPGTRAS